MLALVRAGQRVAVVSDAGTPLVSDPGFRLVRAAIAEGLPVAALPGPNAAVLALVLSGLPPLPFLALGFPPPKQAARRAAFAAIRAAERPGCRRPSSGTKRRIGWRKPFRICCSRSATGRPRSRAN